MADFADVAADIAQTDLDHALQNAKRIEFPGFFDCEECGTEIPEQRRRLGSVTLCIGCQTAFEAKQKHFRG
ncbi:Prokaryotic dksA/traR C4-type zinc finger family protein [Acinetobacter proteolyticus]|uniref:Prokaryotic dksA/traR C4-type zinc finger family protein n=1 Tax=Acinetobacter proteolyticus TaxID=1776741 RepID=A0A653K1V5_9GAMM|nr:TraR/DksA C4-type zinc finger protein [Acinetobacter proteolyticus]VXA54704.1 Prokaryotic dksA/traR C4-type zinc finger family protein [Acinetobacter proteolyticus]